MSIDLAGATSSLHMYLLEVGWYWNTPTRYACEIATPIRSQSEGNNHWLRENSDWLKLTFISANGASFPLSLENEIPSLTSSTSWLSLDLSENDFMCQENYNLRVPENLVFQSERECLS
jgi:hypothetical protein